MQDRFLSKTKIVVAILFLCCQLQAAWKSFTKEDAERTPHITVLSSDESSVVLNVDIFGAEVKEIDTKETTDIGEEIFVLFSVGEYAYTADIGKPKLPMVTSVLDVPHRATIQVEILNADYEEIDLQAIDVDKRIMPALASVPKVSGGIAQFVIDVETYSTNGFLSVFAERVTLPWVRKGTTFFGKRTPNTIRMSPHHLRFFWSSVRR